MTGGEADGKDADAWQALVASFHKSPDTPVPPWPASEDVADEAEPETRLGGAQGEDPQPRIGRVLRFAEPSSGGERRAAAELRRGDDDDDDPPTPTIYFGVPELEEPENGVEERFVPPPLDPMPELDPLTKLGWLGLIGGPLYLIVVYGLNWNVPGWTATLAVIAAVAGFVSLVFRMKDRDDRNDPDHGAVL
jgi:hypothetical protein